MTIAMPKILQLKIVLNNIHPTIWRRILVPDSATFHELHLIIQAAMGWGNSHLHEFNVNDSLIEDPKQAEDEERKYFNSRKTPLSEFLEKEKTKFYYLYDFGDCWEHIISVEKNFKNDKIKIPTCIGGEGSCPPEDCGGSGGYENFLEALADKNHPEHNYMKKWIGGDFDREYFDLKETNSALTKYRSMEEKD